MIITGGVLTSWAEYYRNHDVAQLGAAFGHILAIAYAARHAIAGDAAALRLTSRSARHARRASIDIQIIRSAHGHVIAGLAFAVLTGLAQLLAQLDYLPQSPVFWIKMAVLVLLLVNGRLIQLAGRRATPDEQGTAHGDSTNAGLRAAAIRSITLWCSLVLLGLLLTTVRPTN